MPVAFKQLLGNVGSTTSGSTIVITTTGATVAIGDLIVIRIAADNLSATTPTVSSVSDGTANSYTVHRQGAVNASGAAGVMGALIACRATVGLASGTNITVTLSGSVTARSGYAEAFTGVINTTRSTPVGSSGASGTYTSGTSGAITSGDLILGFAAIESRGAVTGDSDSTNGSWSTAVLKEAATSGTDQARVEVMGQYKIATGTTALAYDATGTNTDWVAGIVVLQQSGDATATPATISMPVTFPVPLVIPRHGTAAPATISTPWTFPVPVVVPQHGSRAPATIAAPFALPAPTASGGGGSGLVTEVTDNFDRANGAPGSNWTELGVGSWTIVSNKLQRIPGGGDWIDWTASLSSVDHWVEADVVGCNTNYAVVHVRSFGVGSICYEAFLVPGASTAEIGRNSSAFSYTMVAQNTSFPHGDAHNVRLEAQGDQIRYYVDDVLAVSATNSVIAGNAQVGLNTNSGSTTFDNFSAGTFGAGGGGTGTPAVIAAPFAVPAASATGSTPGLATPATIARSWLLPAPTASGSGGGGATVVQTKAATNATSVTFNSSTTTGNKVIVSVWTFAENILAGDVTDNKANTYTLRAVNNAVAPKTAVFESQDSPTMGATHQISMAATDTGLCAYEVSGLTATPFDQQASSAGTSATSLVVGPTGTLAQAAEFVVAVTCVDQGDDTITENAGQGWTLTAEAENGSTALCFNAVHKMVSSTTALSATWALGSAHDVSGVIATFKATSGGGGGTATPATIARTFVLPAPSAIGSANGTGTPATISTSFDFPVVEGIDVTVAPATIARAVALPAPTATGSTAGTASPATIARAWLLPTPALTASSTATPTTIARAWLLPAPTATGASAGTATPATIARAWLLPAPSATGSSTVTAVTIARAWLLPAPSASGSSSGTATPATIARSWLLPAPAKVAGSVKTPLTIAVVVTIPRPQTIPSSIKFNMTLTALSPQFRRTTTLVVTLKVRTPGAPAFRTRRPGSTALAHSAGQPVFRSHVVGAPTTKPRTTTTVFRPRIPGPPTK